MAKGVTDGSAESIFVNCPFDEPYKPFFEAIVFTIVRSGYRVRSALETDDASENRLAKICNIIASCRFGIHDISRTELDGNPPLPRFNMPLELGLFLGAKRFGGRFQKAKSCIIFDRERFRFQRFISDISGQDIHCHNGNVTLLIRELTNWLRNQPGGRNVGGGQAIVDDYAIFATTLPNICEKQRIKLAELTFSDFNQIVIDYVAML